MPLPRFAPRFVPCLAAALTLALAMGQPPAARAETTAWAENDGGRMRMTALPPAPDGTARALLEIEPKPGWITYWREPGESGIPPQIAVSGGAALKTVSYPVPDILSLGTVRDIGYGKPVALPLLFEKVTGAADVGTFIGVCNQICIPFQAHFPLALRGGTPEPGEVARVAAALATLPAGPQADFRVDALKTDGKVLTLALTLPAGSGTIEAIATGPAGMVFTATATATAPAAGGAVTLEVPLSNLPAGFDAAATPWTVLVKGAGRAIETEMTPG